ICQIKNIKLYKMQPRFSGGGTETMPVVGRTEPVQVRVLSILSVAIHPQCSNQIGHRLQRKYVPPVD
ncbi:hypothetical protein pipiens_015481, partial [Culex pipiens pipiens]